MSDATRERYKRHFIENQGLDEIEAEFAAAIAVGEIDSDAHAATLPLPEDESRMYAQILTEQHGFTRDEAARYVAGDRTAIEAVFARRDATDARARTHAAD